MICKCVSNNISYKCQFYYLIYLLRASDCSRFSKISKQFPALKKQIYMSRFKFEALTGKSKQPLVYFGRPISSSSKGSIEDQMSTIANTSYQWKTCIQLWMSIIVLVDVYINGTPEKVQKNDARDVEFSKIPSMVNRPLRHLRVSGEQSLEDISI